MCVVLLLSNFATRTAVAIAYYPVVGPHPPIAINVLLLRFLFLPIIF